MAIVRCFIYSANGNLEMSFENHLTITSRKCGFSGESIDFLRLTKANGRIVLSDISPEIGIRFCHCRLQKDVLALDDDFALQILYRGVLVEICVIMSGAEGEGRYSNLRTMTKLPFCVPTVCVYPFYAGVLGILEAHGCGKEWMISNYLLPWCRQDPEIVRYWVDFT